MHRLFIISGACVTPIFPMFIQEKDDAVILLYIDLQKVPLSPSLQAKRFLLQKKTRSVHITTQFMTRRVRKQHIMFGMSQRVTSHPTRFPVCCCLPTPTTLASGGIRCSRFWSTSQLIYPLAISSIIPAGSVHKSRGDSVVRMWVKLKRLCVSCVWVLQRDIVVLDVIWCRLCVNMI